MIGSRIVKKLLDGGYRVRVLSRIPQPFGDPVECILGSVDDDATLVRFIRGVSLVFHCAAELNDPSVMWKVNVEGTHKLFNLARQEGVQYFCHLSSVGVVGKTDQKLVDENTPCNPINEYERTKWEAEQRVASGMSNCTVVILRPTNVVDEQHPGIIKLPLNSSTTDFIKVIVKGRECAHVVHAEDVAAAAVFFIGKSFAVPECFIVSCDNDPSNTVSALWSGCRKSAGRRSPIFFNHPISLPLWVPHVFRKLRGMKVNYGNVRYSSEKIRQHGFQFPLGLWNGVNRIVKYSKE